MINSEFKKSVDRQATEMLAKDPELFVTGKLVRGAFFSFHKMDRASFARSLPSIRDTIVRSFVKRGIAIPTTGERDNEINISGLYNYSIGQSSDIKELWFHGESDDESGGTPIWKGRGCSSEILN